MGEGLCAASESELRADVVAALFAESAFSAWEPYFEGDPVSDLEVLDVRSYGCYCAGRFVA